MRNLPTLTKLLGAVVIACCLSSIAACGSEPNHKDVSARFASMSKYELASDGTATAFDTDKTGKLYVVTSRASLKQVEPSACQVDGQALTSYRGNLNYPSSQGETLFAVAQADISRTGKHQLTCTQPKVDQLLALFEPESSQK